MADRDHPKTRVEDQKLKEARDQPLSPQHEGIDPLTESDTMYPRENTKEASAELAENRDEEVAEENQTDEKEVEENVADQKAVKKSEDKAAEKTADEKSTESKPKAEGSEASKPQTTEPKTS